jgi:hypothetical protein
MENSRTRSTVFFLWLMASAGLAAAIPCARAGEWAGDDFGVVFDSEWIRISIVDDSLEVRGTYVLWCRHHDDTPLSLFYPFPSDSLLGGARMVSLQATVDGIDQGDWPWETAPHGRGVRWMNPPCIADTIAMTAVYRQEVLTSYARYIVTTTRAWQRPIRRARFDVRLPFGAVPLDFSHPFQACGDSLDRYYRYEAQDFFPDRDITVTWKEGAR